MRVTLVDHSTSTVKELQVSVSVKAASVVSTVIFVVVDIMDFLIVNNVSAILLVLNLFQTGHWVTAPYPMRFVFCFVFLFPCCYLRDFV